MSAYVFSSVSSALYAGMTTATRGLAATLDAPPSQDHSQSPKENRQIEAEGPVVQVGEIVAQLDLRLRRVLARDLGETGESRSHRLAECPPRHAPHELAGEFGALGARADQTHVAPKDVPELGNLVDPRGAQGSSDGG